MNICLYGSSSAKLAQIYYDSAFSLGEKMALRGHGLIFGGGNEGLMGSAVRGITSQGGFSLGVAPTFFDKPGILYGGCSEFIFTQTMRERKQIMEERADAFVMVPGGIGTFEEFFEVLTLKQLGLHKKPIAVYNVNGYYDTLASLLQNTYNQGFMKSAADLNLCKIFDDPDELLDYLENNPENNIEKE